MMQGVVIPLFRGFLTLQVEGVENLAHIHPPVLFASNHQSDLDTPAIFAALPWRWRYRVAPAMSQDYFRAWLEPGSTPFWKRMSTMAEYFLAAEFFNAYPLPQHMAGVRRALKYTGELIDLGYCPLVYPEGRRTPDGTLQPFKSGIGVMATRLRAPVVPIHLAGLFEVYSTHDSWPRRGTVKVQFGSPLHFGTEHDEKTVTNSIEAAISRMSSAQRNS
jgi:1-acyl-sn-glycerol-3-phosphate acyltransferase